MAKINLLMGDNRKLFSDVIKSNSKKIILVSDPPFNIGYKYNEYSDNMNEQDYYFMLNNLFGNLPSVVIHYPEALYKLAFQIGKVPQRVVSWVYNSNTARQHRDIAYFDIKPDFSKVKQPYKNLQDKRIKERIKDGIEGCNLYDWWYVDQVKNISKDKTEHPCQMPEDVMNMIIGTLPNDCIVVDPFMGSGTTGVGVIEMNEKQKAHREFIGIEIDQIYYDIASKRINSKLKENRQMCIL